MIRDVRRVAAAAFAAASTVAMAQTSPTTPKLTIAPGKQAAVASVATDNSCERMFEPTSPLTMVGSIADSYLGGLLAPLTGTVPTKARNTAQAEADLRKQFKERSRTTTWLPVEAEEWMGETMMTKVILVSEADEREGRRAADFARVREVFQQLVAALPPDQAYKFTLRFSGDPSVNLTTLPGGMIIVNSGLLPHKTELVTALLAHEIAHVTKRHYTRQIQGYLADTLTVSEIVKAVTAGQAQKARWQTWAAGIGTLDKLFSKFYADQELEADACIPRLVKAANLPYEPPAKAFSVWALADAAAVSKAAPTRAATPVVAGRNAAATGDERGFFEMKHPRSDERVQVLAASLQYWRARDASMRTAGVGAVRIGGSTASTGQQGDASATASPPGTAAATDKPPSAAHGLTDGGAKEPQSSLSDLAARIKRGAKRVVEEVGKPQAPQTDSNDSPGTTGN